MATTQNGIYYPNDGTQAADVLADMKKMAESMEEAINNNKFNPKEINDNITKIQEEQTTQNKAIEANAESIEQNTTDITKLQEENAKLKAQIPKGQASGEEISLSDSAEMELVDFGLEGNSKQDGEPTLENPIEVEAVGDNINIFDNTVETVTSTINDNGIEVPDAATNDYYKQIIIPDSKKYIMSYEKNNQGYVRMAYYNGDTFISRQYSNQNGFIFTVPDNCNKIDCRTNAGTNNGIKFTNLKIEKGEVATSYSPYNQGNVEIVTSNKNVLDLGQGSANGITYNKNRITVINPTNSINITSLNLINNKNFMGKNLTLTFWANGNVETNNVEVHLSTNKETYRFQKYFTTGNFNNTKFAFTRQLQSDEYFTNMTVYVPTTALPTCNLTIDLQMEIKTATDFIEHKGNTYTLPIQKPFYKIGDYADKFTKQNNKWYEQHYIKELTITGGENWKTSGNKYTTYYVQPGIIINKNSATKKLGICNYFEFVDIVWGKDIIACDIGNMYESSFDLRFCFGSNPEFSTVDEWKAKVKALYDAEKPIKFYCVLATPELIECTEEQVQVLEQIVKDGTYKGVTHYYTTEDLKPIIEVKYYKDLETLFKNQTNMQETLNNVQAQLLELGGN